MSGIAGIYHLNQQPAATEDVRQMVKALAHRGPDGADVLCDGPIGLGHLMLWTTPESLHEKLPLVKGSLAITADARIDNRSELAEVLDLPSRPLEKISDSEFILAAYEKWNSDCPNHLLGDFSFLIWDRERQQLFCARDHFGVKPFFYHHSPTHSFSIASEIKGLLCLDWVPCQLNKTRIADYLTFLLEDQEITTFEGIYRLPPATRMWIDDSGVRRETYWSLDPQLEVKLESDQAYAKTFQNIFTRSVRDRLRSVYGVGTHLSGGLDSSSVTCVARTIMDETTEETLHTFSNIFDEVKACDERLYIDEVLGQGGYTPHYIHADTFGPLTDIEKIWQYEDEPLLGPNHYYPWHLNRATNQAGIRIILDGFDGDTVVFHGLHRLTELAVQQRWDEFSEEVKAASKNYETPASALLEYHGLPQLRELAERGHLLEFVKAASYIHKRFQYSRRSLYLKQGVKPMIRKLKSLLLCRKHEQIVPSIELDSLVNRKLIDDVQLKERIDIHSFDIGQLKSVRQSHWHSMVSGVISLNLELVDRYAAAFGLESRHPFLDKRLVEFCYSIPSDQKLKNGFGRVVMRRGLQDILPDKVCWRGGKTNMSSNFLNGMLKINKEIFERVLCEDHQEAAPYLDISIWRASWHRIKRYAKQKKRVELTVKDSLAVWRSTSLTLWLQHMEGRFDSK